MKRPHCRSEARAFALAALAAVSLAAGAAPLAAVDTFDTRMLTQPAVSAERIAFVYANDIWTADLEGRDVRRLTSDVGAETAPAFSPDGRLVAFSGQYDGNTDVYVVPAGGGVPKRLTWHPAADIVQGFTPDGRSVLFTSSRFSDNRSYSQLFTVPVAGGEATMLNVPYAFKAAVSPDGRSIAYNPFPEAFTQWKHYRGGRFSRIWIFDNAAESVVKVPQPEGRSNDVDPMWFGPRIVFRSDRDGEFNLYAYDLASKSVKRLTEFKDFPVLSASGGAGKVVFEQAGALHLYDVAGGTSRRLTIGIATDLPELRERFAKGSQWVRGGSVSPAGARAALEFRGEIVTVPAEKGDPRNLTQTPGVHERHPAWSPDGASIAYFSDASGEYELHVAAQDGKGAVRRYKLGGAGFYGSPTWSPDSRKIAFSDNSLTLFWIDLATGAVKKIASEALYQTGGQAEMRSDWSPDSKWIAYTLGTPTFFRRVHVYSLDQDRSYPVTDGLSSVEEPTFDAEGKHLWFLASTDAGPVAQWFDMSNSDLRLTSSLYLAVLRKDLPNPLAKESDEEKPKEEKKEPDKPAAKPGAPAPAAVRIDFDGLENRIVTAPIPAGVYNNLAAGDGGKLFYRKVDPPPTPTSGGQGESSIRVYDLASRKDEAFGPACDGFELSADRKKILLASRGAWSIIPAAGKPEPGKGRLDLDAVSVRVVPEAEWKQIFDEAWRINRDYFYDPGMHGADWKAVKAKYAAFLPHLACRADLNRLIQWMCSELGVGHHRVGGGDTPAQPARVPGGLLGADYAVENGRYRFKKVFGGLNWTPELRAPLGEPGAEVRAGEYLLAVEGRDLVPPEDLFARFEATAGKIVEVTVGPDPNGAGARTIKVVPVADEGALRNRDWVEGNVRKVREATNGRVAYVYVPNTSTLGHVYFKRYFFPQADKEAVIVDERFNGGGLVADYYLDWLRKPVSAYWAMRYGADLKTPSASIQGPKVMIINESAGSGGDLLPYMWRKFGAGKLVGTATWGGLVGTLGFPVLMDGGSVTAPNLAFWDVGEGFGIENVGVPPDIEVEQTPRDVIAGRDPQLEAAIKVAMDELEANPPAKPKRPPYPVRVKK
ncbi:MAG TPA: PDZ domain-containing protein [Candidatus Aminicenantes bacterium]|nr:PDZ domain-containing protein [Candidatus Aminicenantes bacterium]